MNNEIEWIVKSVKPQSDYTLLLTFADKSTRIFDMKPLLSKPVFQPLKNIVLFMQAKTDSWTVIWNDEIDISPEHLYEYSTLIAG